MRLRHLREIMPIIFAGEMAMDTLTYELLFSSPQFPFQSLAAA
jgi:hypothetical protein